MLTVSLKANIVDIRLTDMLQSTWMRIAMPDGTISNVTTSPYCNCIGLSPRTVSIINVNFFPGMRVEYSSSMAGPWTLAATTQAVPVTPGTPPVSSTAITLGDTSLVTTTMTASTVTAALSANVTGAWLRLMLPDGTISRITVGPGCDCIALGGNSPRQLSFSALRGIRVETSKKTDGPWALAATVN